jgi:hypothetical protein
MVQSQAMPSRASKRTVLDELEHTNSVAKRIVAQTTGTEQPQPVKNPAAVALGRVGASKGGKARAESLLYVVAASYVLTVLLFYGSPRWTLLIVPELLIFASFAIVGVYTYIIGSDRMPRLGGRPGTSS